MTDSTASLTALVQRAVEHHPDEPALEVAGSLLTYSALWTAAGRLARLVKAAHPGQVTRVAVYAQRDLISYLGYLAALRLGAAVIPLNPEFPLARNAGVARSAGADVVIGSTVDACANLARRVGTCTPVTASPEELIGAGPHEVDEPLTRADDLAYLLFTSGSTGTPKGVPISHANVCDYVRYQARQHEAGPGSRFSQTFDLTFDPSVFDLFVAWSSGSTVVVPTRDELSDPVGFVNRRHITHWFSVPSVVTLAKRMRRLSPGSMPGLRWSLFAGEQLTRDQADAWERAAPNSTVENLYGPTELTITCVGYRIPADRSRRTLTHNGTVPIGDPHPLVDHVLIGEDGRPGEQGELCVRGPQRFAGYLRSVDNAGRFVRLDDGVARGYDGAGTVGAELYYRTGDLVSRHPDGMLVHHGRLDNQVKLHGYRVELGEIEAALRTHPRVEDAVVLVPDGSADPVGCYTGEEVAGPELVAALQSRLPWYMVPSQYRHVDGMPLNANGKVDRRALVEALPSSKEGSHDR